MNTFTWMLLVLTSLVTALVVMELCSPQINHWLAKRQSAREMRFTPIGLRPVSRFKLAAAWIGISLVLGLAIRGFTAVFTDYIYR